MIFKILPVDEAYTASKVTSCCLYETHGVCDINRMSGTHDSVFSILAYDKVSD